MTHFEATLQDLIGRHYVLFRDSTFSKNYTSYIGLSGEIKAAESHKILIKIGNGSSSIWVLPYDLDIPNKDKVKSIYIMNRFLGKH